MKIPEFLKLEAMAERLTLEQVGRTDSEFNPIINGTAFWHCPRASIRATELDNGSVMLKFEDYDNLFTQIPAARLVDVDIAAALREYGFERLDA